MKRLLFAIVLAAFASPVAAQPAPWQPERLSAGWTFTPSIMLGAMWDTNVTVQSEGNPTIGETVGLVSPRGEVDFNGRRTRFNMGYSGSLEAYQELDALTRYTQRGRMQARHTVTPRLQFESRTAVTMTPTTDDLELDAVQFARVGARRFDTGGGFGYALTPRTTIKAGYGFQLVQFDRDGADQRFAFLRGGHAHAVTASAMHAVSSRLRAGGSWEYRHAIIGGGEQLFDVQHALAEAAYDFSRTTTVGGGAGVAHLRLSTTATNRIGPSFRAYVEQKVNRASFRMRYERMFVPSFGFGGMNENQALAASAHVPFLGGRMAWSGDIAYRRSEPFVAEGFNIQTDSLWSGTSVSYFATRWLRVDAFVNGTHQTSSARGRVDRTRVGVQFVTSKPVRIQ